MKIIQSFWTAQSNVKDTSFGWLKPRFNALSWVLSSVQLSKYYSIELYTDKIGHEFLIDKLKLPYNKVHIILDELNNYPQDFWALPKIKAYSLQLEPFLHIDGDVFIWKAFSENLLKSNLISQNLEITTDYYAKMWQSIFPNLQYIPSEIEKYILGKNNFACNMGIFGGNDIAFLQKYASKSFEFVNQNLANYPNKIDGNFNIFFEQVLFYEMMTLENKECNYLQQEISNDNDYKGFGDFNKVPFQRTYLHLLGVYKRNDHVCKMLESYVMLYEPEYFKNIVTLFKEDYKYFKLELPNYSFSKQENTKLITQFIENYKSFNIEKIDSKFLFSRDITCTSLFETLYNYITNSENFFIKKLNANTIISEIENGEIVKFVQIEELNNEKSVFPIDEIDEVIFEKISNTISHKCLINEMILMLDYDAQDMKDEFIILINDRLQYFLKYKLIIIFSI